MIQDITPETEQQAIDRGMAMEHALQDQHLSEVFEEFLTDAWKDIVASKPEEHALREQRYMRSQVIVELRQRMQTLRQHGLDARKVREARQAEEERVRAASPRKSKPIAEQA